MTTPFPARCLAAGFLLSALVFTTAGCGNNAKKEAASVSGSVKYRGKPLTAGSVNFISTTGSAGQGMLDESGNYKIEGLEAGPEYKVYIGAPVPGQFAPGTKAPTAPPKFDVIPKYLQPESSGFKTSLKPGPNEYPIDIKD